MIAVMEARSGIEVYRKNSGPNARDMTPEEVDWALYLEGLYNKRMGEVLSDKDKQRRRELESFENLPY